MAYRDYFKDLDYCAEPMYWASYSISDELDITAAEAAAKAEYVVLRDSIYYNTELQATSGISTDELADCMGMAHRIACHRAFNRTIAEDGVVVEQRGLCKSFCKSFHDRCTFGKGEGGVDFVTRGLVESWPGYPIRNVEVSANQPQARPSMLLGFVLTTSFSHS